MLKQHLAALQVYHHLKAITKKKYGQDSVNVGDEGGFAPNVGSAEEALDVIQAAIEVCILCTPEICSCATSGCASTTLSSLLACGASRGLKVKQAAIKVGSSSLLAASHLPLRCQAELFERYCRGQLNTSLLAELRACCRKRATLAR